MSNIIRSRKITIIFVATSCECEDVASFDGSLNYRSLSSNDNSAHNNKRFSIRNNEYKHEMFFFCK